MIYKDNNKKEDLNVSKIPYYFEITSSYEENLIKENKRFLEEGEDYGR